MSVSSIQRGLHLPVGSGALRIGYRTPGLGRDPDPLDAEGKMALAQELDLSVVEPQCAPHEIHDLAVARELRAAADAVGIAIPSTGCKIPLSDPAADLAEACRFAIAVGGILGCDYVFTVVQNPPVRTEPQADTWDRLVARAQEACRLLADAGMVLAIEADHGSFIHTTERLVRLLDGVDGLLANFDPCNLYLGGSDPVASVAQLAGRIRSGHIKDGYYHCGDWREAAVGTGEVDWPAIFAAMRDQGLAVPMHIEHCQQPDGVRDAVRHVRTVIAALS